ncbi:MAG: transglycosylase domain-containing protein [Candidatus Dojkabacteria bacterium]|nr:transglycosylase domain-containing protein [Candidatus Dojkabacteria bacterium]MDQ7020436.1 transglycosylase domain-containing protein [Candidatus Dojkabacteria bacterium]
MARNNIKFKTRKRKSSYKSRTQTIEKNKKKLKGISRSTGKNFFTNKKRKKIFKVLAKVGLVFLGFMFVAGVVGGVVLFRWIQDLSDELPSPDEPFKDVPVASKIYDRASFDNVHKGTELYKLFNEFNSDKIEIDGIPHTVRWAFLAAEDREFYDHDGVDVKGIFYCGYKNLSSGGSGCGASTITQQFLKITIFSDEQNKYERKIKEWIMASLIEDERSKDEILQMYLSVVPFGSNIVGLQTASEFYFGVDPKDLSLVQATILASIIQDPSYLSPTQPVDGDIVASQAAVKERQGYILDEIEDNLDYINDKYRENIDDKNADDIFTKDMVREARVETENIVYAPPIATDKLAGHFVDYVVEALLTNNYKNGEEPFTLPELQQGGYQIITTLDYKQQEIAEQYVAQAGDEYSYWNVNNAALMTIDPNNGQIITMAGSKSYSGESTGCNEYGLECKYDPQVNVLTSLNEPGSTAKVLGYTLAFEKGLLFGGSNIPDIPIEYPELFYYPKNWDSSYLGHELTVRTALRESRNITALEVVELVGIDNYYNQAVKMGYTTIDRAQIGPSVILGGASVKYTEHVAAFGAYANEGKYVPLNPILRILDADGNVIYDATVEEQEVFSPQAVYMINDVLYDLQSIAAQSGVFLASKTGTTENNTESTQLAWNSNQVTLAWAGNNNNDPLDQTYGYPYYVVQPWLSSYIRDISSQPYYEGKDPTFKLPALLVKAGGCNEDDCVGLQSDWMIQGKTPPSYITTEVAKVCKDQEDKLAREVDIETGNSIEKTFKKYKMPVERWQGYLDKYLKNKGISNGKPTEECNIERSNGISTPFFSFSTPREGQRIDNSLSIRGDVTLLSGLLDEVEFYLGDRYLGKVDENFQKINESYNINSLGITDGIYRVTAIATLSNGEEYTHSVSVVVGDVESQNIGFVTFPQSNLQFGSDIGNGIVKGISINYTGNGSISNVQLYQLVNSSTTELVGTMNPVVGGFELSWGGNIPNESKSYSFYVEATTSDGSRIRSAVSQQVAVSPN